MAGQVAKESAVPLFQCRKASGGVAFRVFASTLFVGIFLIWIYRVVCFPGAGEQGRWSWIGMFIAEIVFGFYWICTQAIRWNVTHSLPSKDRLSQRYGEVELPGVDIFVCTADPMIEPPILVMNTILSVMAYNYPTEKLSVYLSDDGGSDLTFYALLEASHFAKHWIPFCKRHNIEPRSPEACVADNVHDMQDTACGQDWLVMKKLYEEMKNRIESTTENGSISREVTDQDVGFYEWKNHKVTKSDHQPIVKIIVDGRDKGAVDDDGSRLPTLVYVAREKRPRYPHHFKAGAMNALIRVSSEISNGSIILNLDCDMNANDSDTIKDALCFFLDEEKGHEIAYVQHPQAFGNITKNDLYANSCLVVNKELAGMGGYGAALYCGTGCFHRRESLCGKNYSKENQENWNTTNGAARHVGKTVLELEEASRVLASCIYEKDTEWGKEMGLTYGCPVEDIVTGLRIQCKGWKSVFSCPDRKSFLGLAPNTLDQALVQHKRWSEGMFQIFFSRFCPFTYAHGKISLGAQLGYCVYLLWAPLSFPTLYYLIVPPLGLLHGFALFPRVSSLWFIPFAYVFIARNVYSVVEALNHGYTIRGWWNTQRMVLLRRTTSYVFAFIDTITKQLGLSQTTFAITAKVVTEDVLERYEQEVMEFGSHTIMFAITATLAMLNLFTLVGAIVKWLMSSDVSDFEVGEMLIPHVVLCGIVVMINVPVYQALFLRHDNGRLPASVMFKSLILASLACLIPIY
uniref:Cellulose synthase-like protein E6 n=1 Tax=Rhizophora mucronata TaxID=61149 RepID=A0A2P2QLH9_RHIMU